MNYHNMSGKKHNTLYNIQISNINTNRCLSCITFISTLYYIVCIINKTLTSKHKQYHVIPWLMSFHLFLHKELTVGQRTTGPLSNLCHFLLSLLTRNHTLCPLPPRLNILPTAVTGLASPCQPQAAVWRHRNKPQTTATHSGSDFCHKRLRRERRTESLIVTAKPRNH